MPINADAFARDLEVASKTIERDMEELLRNAAEDALRTVVLATPVDTGLARGNWQVSINREITAETSRIDRSGFATISAGAGVIDRARLGDTIHIQNNLSYIGELNDGTASQAGAMFVERALQAALASIEKAGGR